MQRERNGVRRPAKFRVPGLSCFNRWGIRPGAGGYHVTGLQWWCTGARGQHLHHMVQRVQRAVEHRGPVAGVH